MRLFKFLTLGPIEPAPKLEAWRPKGPGRRIAPVVPITSKEFKYTPSVETDLRTKFARLKRKG